MTAPTAYSAVDTRLNLPPDCHMVAVWKADFRGFATARSGVVQAHPVVRC